MMTWLAAKLLKIMDLRLYSWRQEDYTSACRAKVITSLRPPFSALQV